MQTAAPSMMLYRPPQLVFRAQPVEQHHGGRHKRALRKSSGFHFPPVFLGASPLSPGRATSVDHPELTASHSGNLPRKERVTEFPGMRRLHDERRPMAFLDVFGRCRRPPNQRGRLGRLWLALRPHRLAQNRLGYLARRRRFWHRRLSRRIRLRDRPRHTQRVTVAAGLVHAVRYLFPQAPHLNLVPLVGSILPRCPHRHSRSIRTGFISS